MTRAINAPMLAGVQATSSETCQLIELQFGAGTTRITTASRDILWNGFTWEAVGGHLKIEPIQETTDEAAQGVGLELSGVDQSILALVLGETYVGRKVSIWYAHLSSATGAILDAPLGPFVGLMNDAWEVEEERPEQGGGTVLIRTRLTSRLAELDQAAGIRCNVHSHRAALAGVAGINTDTFFQTCAGVSGQVLYWGNKVAKWLRPFLQPERGG